METNTKYNEVEIGEVKEMTIYESLKGQFEGIRDNWNKGKIDFGFLSLNVVRADCGLGFADAYEPEIRKEIKKSMNRLCKEFKVRYNKDRNWIEPKE